MDGKEEGEGRHCLLAPGEVLHVAETLERRHGVILDTIQVGLVGVFNIQVPVYCQKRYPVKKKKKSYLGHTALTLVLQEGS